ncbi:MAG TPA: DUF692 domain-containing protein [Gemmatales bacterium]|nr:DUF692 domain-containing protein [Gemmatales bacterium]
MKHNTILKGPTRTGVSWRPELALAIERWPHLGLVELMAESLDAKQPIPAAIEGLHQRGVPLIPHGTSLSLGSAEPPDPHRLDHLARIAERVHAPLVSEHLAFVRGGGLETGHLLPVASSREMLEIVVENVNMARAALPVPLALENISTLFQWPDPEMDEADFLNELLERTDSLLLLDLENVYANCRNFGGEPEAFLRKLPLEKVAYVHVAGGRDGKDGRYHDTHTTPIPQPVFDLVTWLSERIAIPGIILERDDYFPDQATLHAELNRIRAAVRPTGLSVEQAHAK